MTHSPGDILLCAYFPNGPRCGRGDGWHEDVERSGPGVGEGCEERDGGEGCVFEHIASEEELVK